MANPQKKTESPFEEIPEAQTQDYLNGFASRSAKAMIWTNDQKFVLKTEVTAIQEVGKNHYVCLKKESKESEFVRLMEKEGVSSAYIHVSLPDAQVFFRADLRKEDRSFFNFRVQKPIFRAQRRLDIRLSIPEDQKLVVQFSDKSQNKFKQKVLDLSSGGLNFLSVEKSDFFKSRIGVG